MKTTLPIPLNLDDRSAIINGNNYKIIVYKKDSNQIESIIYFMHVSNANIACGELYKQDKPYEYYKMYIKSNYSNTPHSILIISYIDDLTSNTFFVETNKSKLKDISGHVYYEIINIKTNKEENAGWCEMKDFVISIDDMQEEHPNCLLKIYSVIENKTEEVLYTVNLDSLYLGRHKYSKIS